MDIVNFPGIIAEHGLLDSSQVSLAKDLILIGKNMGSQRDGTQYENMAINIAQFANLVSGGGNETLAQTLALGNVTGGNNIIFSGTDFAIFQSGVFSGRLSRLPLTGNQAWNLPDKSGTIALLSDIPVPPPPPVTLYSADGTIASATRNVTVGTNLYFLHGAAGINGYVQMTSGGYFKNSTSVATNYFEYNHNDGTFLAQSDTHTRTGFKAQRSGTFLEMMSGGGKGYFNTNGYIEFYTNNTATYAGMIDSTGKWRFGSATGGVAKVTINGEGNTAATINTLWNNLSGSELMRINDAGQVGINTSDFSTGFGGLTNRFAVRGSNGDYGYHTLGYFENSLNPTANNVYYQRALTSSIVKYGVFNTAQMVGSLSVADIQGGGTINEVYGQHNYIIHRGVATVTDMAGIYADKLIQSGVVTNFASIIAHTTQLAGGTITNMYGLWVRTPVNVSGGTRTNTYGILIEPNVTGTNNYGVVSSGQMSNGFGTLTPSLNALTDFATTSKAPVKLGGGMTVAQAGALTAEDSMIVYVTDTDGTFPTVGLYCREAGVWNKL